MKDGRVEPLPSIVYPDLAVEAWIEAAPVE
jgi:hypothetical protein